MNGLGTNGAPTVSSVAQYGPDTITSRARSLARIVDNGVRDGLPEPYGIFSADYTEPAISMREFADVEAWAAWLGVRVKTETRGEAEFCEATARRDGFTLKVATNRPTRALPPTDGCGAVDSHQTMRDREHLSVCPICNADLARPVPPATKRHNYGDDGYCELCGMAARDALRDRAFDCVSAPTTSRDRGIS